MAREHDGRGKCCERRDRRVRGGSRGEGGQAYRQCKTDADERERHHHGHRQLVAPCRRSGEARDDNDHGEAGGQHERPLETNGGHMFE